MASATRSFARISKYKSQLHALQLHASILDVLGRVEERDEISKEFMRLEEEWEDDVLSGPGLEKAMKEVWEVANGVLEIGVAISLGRV